MTAVGVKAAEQDGTLVIQGGLSFEHGTPSIETFGDHRMAMTACLIAAWTGQTVYIDNKDCVNKSFPGLFELIEKSTKTADDGIKE